MKRIVRCAADTKEAKGYMKKSIRKNTGKWPKTSNS